MESGLSYPPVVTRKWYVGLGALGLVTGGAAVLVGLGRQSLGWGEAPIVSGALVAAELREGVDARLKEHAREAATEAPAARFGVKAPEDNLDPHVARQQALRDAAELGMIGLLNAGAGGDPDAPTAPWGRDDAIGDDLMSARGNKWGDSIGDAFGVGGLGLEGIGKGGGGTGEGIGLGTIGHGSDGLRSGQGTGSGDFGGAHLGTKRPKATSALAGTTAPTDGASETSKTGKASKTNDRKTTAIEGVMVLGGLDSKAVNRLLKKKRGAFHRCLAGGSQQPAAKGEARAGGTLRLKLRINAEGRFVLGDKREDTVLGNSFDDGSVSCVLDLLEKMTFPRPKSGTATITMRLVLAP